MHVVEVVLGRTAGEMSEVRCVDQAIRWFRSHAEALQFAARYAAALEGAGGGKPFVSVCRSDGTWVPMSDLDSGIEA